MPLQSGQIIIIDILSPSTNNLIYYTLSNTINVHVKVQNYPFGGGGYNSYLCKYGHSLEIWIFGLPQLYRHICQYTSLYVKFMWDVLILTKYADNKIC